jgi:transcriptional regulator with XRE-family HTH domain
MRPSLSDSEIHCKSFFHYDGMEGGKKRGESRDAMPKPFPPRKQYRRTFIREWRKYRGLTIEQLAGRVDVQPSALSYLERGQSGYTQGTLESIAHALSTTPEALLTVDPNKEGEVVDLLRLIDDRNRAQAIRVLRALTGTDPQH